MRFGKLRSGGWLVGAVMIQLVACAWFFGSQLKRIEISPIPVYPCMQPLALSIVVYVVVFVNY
jgi:hypothetical protein